MHAATAANKAATIIEPSSSESLSRNGLAAISRSAASRQFGRRRRAARPFFAAAGLVGGTVLGAGQATVC